MKRVLICASGLFITTLPLTWVSTEEVSSAIRLAGIFCMPYPDHDDGKLIVRSCPQEAQADQLWR
jgi:hypothetical protein